MGTSTPYSMYLIVFPEDGFFHQFMDSSEIFLPGYYYHSYGKHLRHDRYVNSLCFLNRIKIEVGRKPIELLKQNDYDYARPRRATYQRITSAKKSIWNYIEIKRIPSGLGI